MPKAALGVAIVAASVGAAGVAWAATPPPASLVVKKSSEAAGCPDAGELARRVNEITGWPALATMATASTRLHFEVALSASEAGHAATIHAKGVRSGVRRIADIGSDCAGLADALAVTLAIIVDDERVAPADPIPTPISRSIAPQPPATERAAPAPVWRPHLGVAASLGVLESVAFGPAGGFSVEIERWVLGGDLWWLPARTFQLSPGETDVSLLGAGIHACWKVAGEAAPSWIALCGQLSGGRLTGSAAGYTRNRSAHRPWVAPAVGALAATPISGPIELFGSAKLLVPVHRERFVIDNVGAAHETPPLGALLTIGVSLAIR